MGRMRDRLKWVGVGLFLIVGIVLLGVFGNAMAYVLGAALGFSWLLIKHYWLWILLALFFGAILRDVVFELIDRKQKTQ